MDYPEVKSGQQPDVPDEAYEVPFGEGGDSAKGPQPHLGGLGAGYRRCSTGAAGAGPSRESARNSSICGLSSRWISRHWRDRPRKTRRLLVVEHGHYTAGFSAHVVSEVVQRFPASKSEGWLSPMCRVGRGRHDVLVASRRPEDRRCGQAADEGVGRFAPRLGPTPALPRRPPPAETSPMPPESIAPAAVCPRCGEAMSAATVRTTVWHEDA